MAIDKVLHGLHVDDVGFMTEDVDALLKMRGLVPGKYNFVSIRPPFGKRVDKEVYFNWAKKLSENEVYFVFLYTIQQGPIDSPSHLTNEIVDGMKEIAGEYYLGDMIGETGSDFACKWAGYFDDTDVEDDAFRGGERVNHDNSLSDMEAAHKKYISEVGKLIEIDHELDVPGIMSVEATALNRYNAEAGVDLPMLELMCGHPEILLSSLRGTARAYNSKLWGTYVAHTWYGGMRHTDMLKRKRLKVAYDYAYLAGSEAFCLEAGDKGFGGYGYRYEYDHVLPREYRKVLSDFSKFIKKDKRPKGGPKAKVAFLQGNHDAWGSWGGTSVWNQFGREEWGQNEAEHSWRLLDEIGTKRVWNDISNYGDEDLSALPAYGQYDVIPTEAPLEVYKSYDYLIFVGWNSMTDEIYDKLIAFVEGGGKLLASAAHLNYSVKRDGEKILPSNEKLEKLFGVRFTGERVTTNAGLKLVTESKAGIEYPGSLDKLCDPILSGGYVTYLKCEITTGFEVGELSESFVNRTMNVPAIVENELGAGVATLITCENYPGHPAFYPLYRTVVRAMLTQSARDCEIKVKSGGALRYSVYEGGKMYLLNTDYDMPISVEILANGKTKKIKLRPMELKTIKI